MSQAPTRSLYAGGMDGWSWPYEVEALQSEIAECEAKLADLRAALVEAELMAQLSTP